MATAGILSPVPPPVLLDLSRLSGDSNPQLALQLSPPHSTVIVTGENPSLSAPTVTLPYHYYQEEGLYTVPHSRTLNLPPPSTAENQSIPLQLSPSHHPLIVTGENPSLSDYQEDGLYTVPHSPTLNLPPPSTAENQPLSFQHSPSHQPLFVTGENPSLSASLLLHYHIIAIEKMVQVVVRSRPGRRVRGGTHYNRLEKGRAPLCQHRFLGLRTTAQLCTV
ncbi:Uncharacterized protein Fot_46186 [Forsythia ovata]|uniref:Uncharacterized protein n=1 Tax=Forsythia ovata TaxID=205694 RepID=A0ABD1QN21_9LAMI